MIAGSLTYIKLQNSGYFKKSIYIYKIFDTISSLTVDKKEKPA